MQDPNAANTTSAPSAPPAQAGTPQIALPVSAPQPGLPIRPAGPPSNPTQPSSPAQVHGQAPAPPQWTTLTVATCNILNLALPGHLYYENQDPYDEAEYLRKTQWLGGMLERVNADICGVQEVWDEAALKAAVARSGLRYSTVIAPGAENPESPGGGAPSGGASSGGASSGGAPSGGAPSGGAPRGGASGTPRVGLATRLQVDSVESIVDFAAHERVQVPELGEYRRFERPVLLAGLRLRTGQRLHVLVCHLKSKRPKLLQDAAGNPTEDRDDPVITARATLRSLLMRGAEAAALRGLVLRLTSRSRDPLILLGDLNDGPHSVTTQMIAATQAVAYDRQARDVALYHAWDVQSEPGLRRDMAYSHVHQGWPELLDQIWVSEEFVGTSRFALGDVKRVEVFNDHLHESRERWRSDHGFVRALLRLRMGA